MEDDDGRIRTAVSTLHDVGKLKEKGTYAEISPLKQELENRYQELKARLGIEILSPDYSTPKTHKDDKKKRVVKRVCWADEVGKELNSYRFLRRNEVLRHVEGAATHLDQGEGRCIKTYSHEMGAELSCLHQPRRTYKQVLLKPAAPPSAPNPFLSSTFKEATPSRNQRAGVTFAGRCFRCLATDHRVVSCRDPIKCVRCLKIGHIARYCKELRGVPKTKMHRERQTQERKPPLNVFFPWTEDFSRRREQRQNAVLINIVRPANLGRPPTETIVNGLVARFGGYPADFHVARYHSRHFVVFLPARVQADDLIRKEMIQIGRVVLRCFKWRPFRGAVLNCLSFKVWIKLLSLPYECWSSPKVAAIVNGFGRFVCADEASERMANLSAFTCQVVVEDLSDIPASIDITLGDIKFNILVQISRWERIKRDQQPPLYPPPASGGSHRGEPSNYKSNVNRGADQNRNVGNVKKEMGDKPKFAREGMWDSSTIRDRRCCGSPEIVRPAATFQAIKKMGGQTTGQTASDYSRNAQTTFIGHPTAKPTGFLTASWHKKSNTLIKEMTKEEKTLLEVEASPLLHTMESIKTALYFEFFSRLEYWFGGENSKEQLEQSQQQGEGMLMMAHKSQSLGNRKAQDAFIIGSIYKANLDAVDFNFVLSHKTRVVFGPPNFKKHVVSGPSCTFCTLLPDGTGGQFGCGQLQQANWEPVTTIFGPNMSAIWFYVWWAFSKQMNILCMIDGAQLTYKKSNTKEIFGERSLNLLQLDKPLVNNSSIELLTDSSVARTSHGRRGYNHRHDKQGHSHKPEEDSSQKRSSARLATKHEKSILEKAKARKRLMDEGDGIDLKKGKQSKSHRKIKIKGGKCGVKLSDEEVVNLKDFLKAND